MDKKIVKKGCVERSFSQNVNIQELAFEAMADLCADAVTNFVDASRNLDKASKYLSASGYGLIMLLHHESSDVPDAFCCFGKDSVFCKMLDSLEEKLSDLGIKKSLTK